MKSRLVRCVRGCHLTRKNGKQAAKEVSLQISGSESVARCERFLADVLLWLIPHFPRVYRQIEHKSALHESSPLHA